MLNAESSSGQVSKDGFAALSRIAKEGGDKPRRYIRNSPMTHQNCHAPLMLKSES